MNDLYWAVMNLNWSYLIYLILYKIDYVTVNSNDTLWCKTYKIINQSNLFENTFTF